MTFQKCLFPLRPVILASLPAFESSIAQLRTGTILLTASATRIARLRCAVFCGAIGHPCDVFNKIIPYYVIKFKFIRFYFQPGKNLLSARQYRIDWRLPLMPCSNSPTALLCCMWGQRNGSNVRNLKPASAAS